MGMPEYLDRPYVEKMYRRERGMRVSRPKTQFMDFTFGQNERGNREPVNVLGEELEIVR